MDALKRDTNSNEPSPDGKIRGLKRELAGYVANGNADRADEVRAELAKLEGGGKAPQREPVERAVVKAPERAEPVRKSSPRKKGSRA